MTTALPRLAVLKVPTTNTYVYRTDGDVGSVVDGEIDIFSELVKLEIERSQAASTRVHLRFCFNNKYWQKSADSDSIVAKSNKPEEDATSPSCTLFQPTLQSGDKLYLTHVQTGWRVMVNSSTGALYLDKNGVGTSLAWVGWETLVKLPSHVAFKGNNEQYLKAYDGDAYYLQFGSSDPNSNLSDQLVTLVPDGHVRLYSNFFKRFWRRDSSNWIKVDSSDVTANNTETLFWPVKVEGDKIALISAGNDKFCKRLSSGGKENFLAAVETTIAKEATLEVKELVNDRQIFNVRYRLDDARVYEETPYFAGTATVENKSTGQGSLTVSVKYEDTKTYSFTRSTAITAGVTSAITAGVPLIGEVSIEITASVSTGFEWNTTTSETKTIEVIGTVPVPGRSIAVVHCIGTRGICDVPFNYTQQDRSSVDGKYDSTDHTDGVFTGVNNYNFKFTVESYQPIPDPDPEPEPEPES